jgi:hypothetical protein
MNTEKHFFKNMANLASPDWEITLNAEPGQINLPDQSVRLYLLDTSTGWTVAGAMPPKAFGQAIKQAKAAGLTGSKLLSAADGCMAAASRGQLAHDAPEVLRALQVVTAALTVTKAYDMVKPDFAGHWVYLAYRGLDASITCRPAFFRAHVPGFVPVESLHQFARLVVAQDLANKAGQVSTMLKRAGGFIIAPMFK